MNHKRPAWRGTRLLALLLALVLTVSLMPISVLAADETPATSGTCTDTITWTYDPKAMTFTLTGTGEIPGTWEDAYNDPKIYTEVKKLIIGEGITGIDNWVFYDADFCEKLEEISLPSTLTTIGDSAFGLLTNVDVIRIPASVTSIGSAAFDEWTGDQQIVFPKDYSRETVASFPSGWNGGALVVYGEPVTFDKVLNGSCGENATFSYDTETGVLTVSGTGAIAVPTDDPARLYWQKAASATSVKIGSGITEIGEGMFRSWTSLASVELPDTLTKIGKDAFYDTSALTEITVPAAVTSIGATAFKFGPKTIHMAGEKDDVMKRMRYFGAQWSGSATVMCGEETLTVPEVVEANDEGTVFACYDASTGTVTIYGEGEATKSLTSWQSKATTAVVEEGVTALDGCFGFYRFLTSVTLPSTLKKLGGGTFSSCKKLSTLVLPDGLEEIGKLCFSGSSALTEITLPASIRVLRDSAFSAFSASKKIYVDMTLEEADAKITCEKDWWGNAKVYYKNAAGDGYEEVDPAPYGWLRDVEFTFTENGKVLKSSTSISVPWSWITYEVDNVETQGDFTIENAGLTLTKDGQPFTDAEFTMPTTLHVVNDNGSWKITETVVLTPKEGIRGKAQTLELRVTLEQKPYQFEGEGTETNPYKINSLADLKGLQANVNDLQKTYEGEYFLQTADIDMTGVENWKAIGFVSNNSARYPLKATYDGGGHRILNWTVDVSTQSNNDRYIGLFGNVNVLKHLTLDESCKLSLRSWSGTLAYQVTRLEDCHSYATVTAQTTGYDNANASIGGLVKTAMNMIDCTNHGSITVTGGGTVGGLAVGCYNASGCYNYGAVSATGTGVGGICA